MAGDPQDGSTFVPVADIEVEAVRPVQSGFRLEGRGSDGADYRMELHLDMPVDRRTRTVLAELLAQSECRVARRIRPPLSRASRRARSRTSHE